MTGSELEAEELLRGAFIRAFRQNEEPDGALIDEALLEQLRNATSCARTRRSLRLPPATFRSVTTSSAPNSRKPSAASRLRNV